MSSKNTTSRWFLTIASALACAAAASPAVAQSLKVGGTGSALGTMQALADAYRKKDPSFEMTVVPNLGSGGGIKAAIAGALDFAVVSRALKADEAAAGLVALEYGRTPFVVVTNKPGVTDMTVAQLAEVVAGRASQWKDGSPVRLVLRPTSDNDHTLLSNFSPEMKQALVAAHAREGMVIGITDQDSANEAERLPGSLGTSSLALLLSENRKLQPIAINGVKPTIQALAQGSYPYVKQMYIVTKGKPAAPVQRFVDFALSAEGRELLARLGHVPAAAR